MSNEEAERRPKSDRSLTNIVVVGVGGLYTVGLLIVNINLGQYGVTHLNLARAEYAIAGALWAFLTAVASSAFTLIVGNWKARWSAGRRKTAPLAALAETIIAISLLSFIVRELSRGSVTMFEWPLLPILLAVAWNGLLAGPLIGIARATVTEGFPLKLLAPATAFEYNRAYLIVMALTGIAGYATVVFPVMPQEFGGGKKPIVRLLLSTSEDWVKKLGLPVSDDGGLGPVMLLLETDAFLILSREPVKRSGSLVPTLQIVGKRADPAVAIDKKVVAAVVHLDDPASKQKAP